MKLGPKKMNILLYDLSTKTTRVKENLESKWRSDNVNLLTCRTESILKTGFETAKPLSNGQSVSTVQLENHLNYFKGTIIFVIADLIREVINQPVDLVFAHHLGLTKTLFNMVIKEHKDQSRQRFQPTTVLSTLRSSIASSSHLFLHPLHPPLK